MSSKSNPIAFRLSKNDISQSQWYAYNNYATILHDDLMIREMIKYTYQRKFLSWVNQIIIRRTSRGIFIFIYAFTSRDVGIELSVFQIQQLENMIQKYLNIQNQKIQIFSYNYYNLYNMEKNELFNEVSNTFGHLKWLSLQKEFLRLAFVAVYSRNVTAFCNFVAVRLGRAKRHKKIIFITRQLLSEFILFKNDLIGVRIRFKGRLDGKPRAKQMFLQTGHVPLHTISATISYHLTHVYSKYGTFGLRIWLCFTQSNIEFFNKLNQIRLEKIKNNVDYKKNQIDAIETRTLPTPEIFHSYMITKPSESFDVLKLKQIYLNKKQWWFSNQYEIVSLKIRKINQKPKTLNYLVQKTLNNNLILNQNGYLLWLFLNKKNNLSEQVVLKLLNNLHKKNIKSYYNQILIDLISLDKNYNFEYNNLILTYLNKQANILNSDTILKDETNRKDNTSTTPIQLTNGFENLIGLINDYRKVKKNNKTYKSIISTKINLIQKDSKKKIKKN